MFVDTSVFAVEQAMLWTSWSRGSEAHSSANAPGHARGEIVGMGRNPSFLRVPRSTRCRWRYRGEPKITRLGGVAGASITPDAPLSGTDAPFCTGAWKPAFQYCAPATLVPETNAGELLIGTSQVPDVETGRMMSVQRRGEVLEPQRVVERWRLRRRGNESRDQWARVRWRDSVGRGLVELESQAES